MPSRARQPRAQVAKATHASLPPCDVTAARRSHDRLVTAHRVQHCHAPAWVQRAQNVFDIILPFLASGLQVI